MVSFVPDRIRMPLLNLSRFRTYWTNISPHPSRDDTSSGEHETVTRMVNQYKYIGSISPVLPPPAHQSTPRIKHQLHNRHIAPDLQHSIWVAKRQRSLADHSSNSFPHRVETGRDALWRTGAVCTNERANPRPLALFPQ
jgi:hypothetical protein